MFDLPLSLVQLLPRLPGLCALAGRTDYPFLGCSSKWIWGQSIYALSWKATLILPSHMFCRLLITLCDSEIYQWSSPPCFSTVNFRAEKKKPLGFAFLSRVMQSSGMLFLETTATAELCNVAEWQMICGEKRWKNVPSVYCWENSPLCLGSCSGFPLAFWFVISRTIAVCQGL